MVDEIRMVESKKLSTVNHESIECFVKWLQWERPVSGKKYESWWDQIKNYWRKRALEYES